MLCIVVLLEMVIGGMNKRRRASQILCYDGSGLGCLETAYCRGYGQADGEGEL